MRFTPLQCLDRLFRLLLCTPIIVIASLLMLFGMAFRWKAPFDIANWWLDISDWIVGVSTKDPCAHRHWVTTANGVQCLDCGFEEDQRFPIGGEE